MVSCATKYVIPGARFMTPETHGRALSGQVDIGQSSSNLVSINTTNGRVTDGVKYEDSNRLNFLVTQSIFDPLDIFINHTASANSMLGIKYQFLGAHRVSNGTGHKAGIALSFGENEYETDDRTVEFNLGGKEYMAMYGYRFAPNVLVYSNLMLANYDFDGTIKKGFLAGRKPKYSTSVTGLTLGTELGLGPFISKLECLYQKLETEDTNESSRFILGYSLGLAW